VKSADYGNMIFTWMYSARLKGRNTLFANKNFKEYNHKKQQTT